MIEGSINELRRQASELSTTTLNGKSMKYAGDVLDKLIDEVTAKIKPHVPPMASASPKHKP